MDHRLSVCPAIHMEKWGPPRLLGHPLQACRSRRPRWVRNPCLPITQRPPWPSGCTMPWAPRMNVVSWLQLLRPTCSPTYASSDALPRQPQGSATSVGGLAPHRAGFAPAGWRTEFHDLIAGSLLSAQPCLATPCTNAEDRRAFEKMPPSEEHSARGHRSMRDW